MEKLRALGRGTQIMFIAAVLLLIVSFFRWQEVTFDLGTLGSGSAGQNALHGFWGWMMFLLTVVLVARIAARLAAVEVPIPLSFASTSFVLGVLIAICAVLKLITDDYRTFWAFIGVGLAIVVAVGAWLEVQEAGGVEHLKSQVPSSGAPAPAAGAPAAEAPAHSTTAPPAAEPAAPPPPPPPPASEAAPAAPPMGAEAQSEPATDTSEGTPDTPSTERDT
jgi:hypothetical protein